MTVIPFVEKELKNYFFSQGFDFRREENDGIVSIFVRKGDVFREILGLHSALHIQIAPTVYGNVEFRAGVSFWEHQKGAGL